MTKNYTKEDLIQFRKEHETLVGIDSQNCPMPYRLKTWEKMANEWKLSGLDDVVTEVDLEGLDERINLMLTHKHKGRTIVNIDG